MPIRLMDGFDLYNTPSVGTGLQNQRTIFPWIHGGLDAGHQPRITANRPRTGRCSIGCIGGRPGNPGVSRGQLYCELPTSSAAMQHIYFSFNWISTGTTAKRICAYDSTTTFWSIFVNTSSDLELRNPANNVVWSTPVSLDTYYDCCFELNVATGQFRFYFQQQEVYNQSVGAGVPFIRFGFRANVLTSTTSSNWRVDDFVYITNEAFIPVPISVLSFVPEADRTQQDWTPNPATADIFERVNNTPIVDGEFIESSTVGDIADFDMQVPTQTIFQVYGVQTIVAGQRTAATTVEVEARFTVASGTLNSSPYELTQAGIAYRSEIFDINPLTGSPWLVSDLIGSGLGVERVT